MAHELTLAAKVAFLRDPASYADGTTSVESIETHFAWLFLTETHVYKLKKPVRHERMDYRTLAAREWGCREELRLNRRLAPSVYEGVLALSERNGRLVIGEGDRVQDWLVKMKRLPLSRMLDNALRLGKVKEEDLEPVAATMARFFARAEPVPVDDARYLEKLKMQVQDDEQALLSYGTRLPMDLATEVATMQRRLITDASVMLGERGAHVVEGHGDLRAEHVCLGPPVAVIDCLEFDRELRLLDPAEEMALLALEMEQLGYPGLAESLLTRFCALSAHSAAPCVLDFYVSRRAAARAKLAAWHLDDPQFSDPRPWIGRVESLLTAAASHAQRALRALPSTASELQTSGGGQR